MRINLARRVMTLLLLASLSGVLALEAHAFPPPPTLEPADLALQKDVPETLADLRAIQKRVEKVVERTLPCTVAVWVEGTLGSGVIISKDGKVLTAGHVSGDPNRRVTLHLSDGRRIQGRTLGYSETGDMGLIQITESGEWPFVELGGSDAMEGGDWCLAMGHPGGYQRGRAPVVRLGRIVRAANSFLRTDCPLVGGDSGGPLFDLEGRVIGIHSRIRQDLTENFHVPIDRYVDSWDRLVRGDYFGIRGRGPLLGFRGTDHDGGGCRITELLPGLPAQKAGLAQGDVIQKANDRKIDSLDDFQAFLQGKKAGDEVTVEVSRRGKRIVKKVKLASRD